MSNYLFLLRPFSFALVLLLGSMCTIAQPTGDTAGLITIPINTDRSRILWKGTEMWQSGKHEGTVTLGDGYLIFTGDHLRGGKFVADMNTIAVTDIPKDDPVPRRRLRNHLKSEDFFYVEKYPKAIFEITSSEQLKADSLRIRGDLSIRDVTKPVSFIALKKVEHDSTLSYMATFKIDRFDWNISYQGSYWERLTSILDNTFVDADIDLTIYLVADSRERRVQ